MRLGAFSVSLSVKDINVSREFYLNLGFEEMGGNIEQNWLILKNGETVIGLFQGMFEKNIMTFNPGWNQKAENTEDFDDVRVIQEDLKSKGIEIINEASLESEGPENFIVVDPDGNQILFDQHR